MKIGKKDFPFTLCLSHDIDRPYKTYQAYFYMLKAIKNYNIGDFKYQFSSLFKENPYWNFEKVVELEKKHCVKSTFFFLNESIKFNLLKPSNWKLSFGRYSFDDPKISRIIKWLDTQGWEIGLHGSYNSYRDYSLLKNEKEHLENVLGHKVNGIRQHYLNLNEKTWEIQKKAGFLYDSTYSLPKIIGYKDEHYQPFYPFKDSSFIVVPLVMMDNLLMQKKEIKRDYLGILDLAEKKQGFVVLNWHQRTFNEKEFPKYSSTYEEIIQIAKDRGARIGPIYRMISDYIR